MSERVLGKHYFREWRQHRGLSLAKAVARMEAEPGGDPFISSMSLSRIERGEQPYSEEVVNALADVYECEPFMLFTVNPWPIWMLIPSRSLRSWCFNTPRMHRTQHPAIQSAAPGLRRSRSQSAELKIPGSGAPIPSRGLEIQSRATPGGHETAGARLSGLILRTPARFEDQPEVVLTAARRQRGGLRRRPKGNEYAAPKAPCLISSLKGGPAHPSRRKGRSFLQS